MVKERLHADRMTPSMSNGGRLLSMYMSTNWSVKGKCYHSLLCVGAGECRFHTH